MKKIPCQVWSRVVGYYRPTSSWNKAKQQEFRDRVPFDLSEREWGRLYQGRQTPEEEARQRWEAAEGGVSVDTSLYLDIGGYDGD